MLGNERSKKMKVNNLAPPNLRQAHVLVILHNDVSNIQGNERGEWNSETESAHPRLMCALGEPERFHRPR